MLIKIPDADDAFVEKLKRQTGSSTGSKAYAKAAAEYDFLVKTVEWQKREIARLEELVAVRDQTLKGARSAAILLLEATGQGDLLNDSVPESSPARRRPAPAADDFGTETKLTPQVGETMDHFLARLNRQGRS
ncbi:hypothetical protein [Pseudomonas sp. TCU-HL1]|uniref:hypothetical protein n=1 Tax=Pseudomonas sp. TCU-HL1 TaxID=1856685 RepID=UPI00083D1D25|nr:hypothetical protein [Pseudomonas sp. TCU-HL1]AOE85626.1 hypothetical protein THL1_3078 [Pseudomonas sp. TCU-HL1]AOE85638.1 hypothetical protein THL1_3090 [Pseudomonas sp. TCU-HL1]